MAHDILIVDDEADIRELVSGILEDEGYTTRTAADGFAGLDAIKERQPSLVILDVWLGESDRDGLMILDSIKKDHPFVPVIMISGHGTIETAVSAIKKGAYDFVEKPFQSDRLLLIIQRAIETARLKRENAELKIKAGTSIDLEGETSALTSIRQTIEKVAQTNSRVFISGPSGSGKELIARKIHGLSRRADAPFVVMNCSTIHPDRLEADLFGLEIRDASPSLPRKIGIIEQAHGGTLFLDEVADLPIQIQGKLVRVLQEQAFTRLGDAKKIPVDIRVIASTAADINKLIKEGSFREDLYYRLNVVPIAVPPLTQRVPDIPLLVNHFMKQASLSHGRPVRILSDESMVQLQNYKWPGNVRQLKNVIEYMVIMASGHAKDPIPLSALPPEIRGEDVSLRLSHTNVVVLPLREAREAFERDYLQAQVSRFGGNISKTARFIGMERSALHRKLRALGLFESKEEDGLSDQQGEDQGESMDLIPVLASDLSADRSSEKISTADQREKSEDASEEMKFA